MNQVWPWFIVTRRKKRRMKEIEENYSDERSDRMLSALQDRKRVVEGVLHDRQRRNHWQEAMSQLIQQRRI